jgi:hypothetical protein
MRVVGKVTFSGGTPEVDLFSVIENKDFAVHLYTCNRSQLLALATIAIKVVRAMPVDETTPTRGTVEDLLALAGAAGEGPLTPDPLPLVVKAAGKPPEPPFVEVAHS